MQTKTIRLDSKSVTACKLSDAVRKGNYVYNNFKRQWVLTATAGASVPAGGATTTNEFMDGLFAGSFFRNVGAATILGPAMDNAVGKLDISGDQTTLEGSEFVPGGLGILNQFGMTVNTTTVKTAVRTMVRVSGTPVTVANVGHWIVGFRKNQAYQVLFDDYTDLAAISMIGTAISVITILNNAATVSNATGLVGANATAADFGVDVEPNGRAHFYKSGRELGTGLPNSGTAFPRFTFDAGDQLIPFFIFNHGASATKFHLNDGEFGPREELNQSPR